MSDIVRIAEFNRTGTRISILWFSLQVFIILVLVGGPLTRLFAPENTGAYYRMLLPTLLASAFLAHLIWRKLRPADASVSVFARDGMLHVRSPIRSSMPLDSITGFREENASTRLFRTNTALIVETEGRHTLTINSAYNDVGLDVIRDRIHRLRGT